MKKSTVRLFSLFVAVMVFLLLLSACSNDTPSVRQGVKHVGNVPESLAKIVEEDLFNGASYHGGKLFKVNTIEIDNDKHWVARVINVYDINGNKLATNVAFCLNAYRIKTITVTEDGGFIYVLGFDELSYGNGKKASDYGVASRVVKCDSSGITQFDVSLSGIKGESLQECIEYDGKYYFFGDINIPDESDSSSKNQDVYMTVLDKSGNVVKTKRIEGEKYDYLKTVELLNGKFIVYINSQSNAKDYQGLHHTSEPTDWIFTIDANLEIVDKKIESGKNGYYHILGESNGQLLYDRDERFKDYDAGTPELYIEYEDYNLIVSTNYTGYFEDSPPYLSYVWQYSETVYSGFDKEGNLLFRTSVDSSPDFEAWLEEIEKED